MTRTAKLLTATVATAILLSACSVGPAVGPEYKRPGFSLPLQWLGLQQPTTLLANAEEAKSQAEWWKVFNDPTLDKLMQQALVRNNDLQIARANIAQARASRLAANAALYPQVGAQASASRGDANASGNLSSSVFTGLNASWEIDLFGGNRRAAQAARAALGGAVAEAEYTRIALLAEVASNYLTVRQLQNQLAIARQNLSDENDILKLVQAQFQEGVVSRLVVAQSQAQAASTAASIPQLESSLTTAQNALGVLVGAQPKEIGISMDTVQPIPMAAPQVVVQAPADVILNRPDVQAAERNLQAAVANQGVALSNWFPKINLTGLFGLTNYGGGNTQQGWSAGGVVSLPLLDFGAVRAQVRTSNAKQQSALASYEKAVLSAMADVESSLNAYVKAVEASQKLTESANASREAFTLATAQYKEGVASHLDVLTAEQSKLTAESAEAQGKATQGQALAALYKALGGF